MLMIISYHIFYHCIYVQLTDVSMITRPENNWYCYPLFSKRLCILAVIAPMGQIGNAIFILISGYFMAYKDAIDLTKISKKLLIQLGFAAVVLGLVSIYAYRNITEFSIALVPFSAFNEMSGFIGYYFTVIVIAKIFLNGILNRLTQKNYAMLLMTLFAFIQFAWSASILANLAQGLELLCTGLFLYLLGGYIKKYDPFESIRLWAVISIIIVTNLIVIGNFYISTASQILSFNPERGDMFIQQIPTYGNNHIVPIVLGIAVFELFKRIKIRRNYVVNFCGGGGRLWLTCCMTIHSFKSFGTRRTGSHFYTITSFNSRQHILFGF